MPCEWYRTADGMVMHIDLTVFTHGYMLGIQTARVMLASMPKAVFNGVQI